MNDLGADEEAASRDIVTDLPPPLSFPLVHRRSMARDPEPKCEDASDLRLPMATEVSSPYDR